MPNANVNLGQQFISSIYDTDTGVVTFGKADGTNTTLNLKGSRRWVSIPSDANILQPPVDTFFQIGNLPRSINITPMLQFWPVVWEFQAAAGDIQLTLLKGTNGYIYDVEGNVLVSSQTSYTITIPSYTTLKIEGIYDHWIITYGSGQETYARSGELGLVSTQGITVNGVVTKHKTSFVHSSGTAFTADTTVTLPATNVDLGDLPSVATTDFNVLSGTGTRIVGGNNNTVSGTDNIAIGCTYANFGVNGTNLNAVGLMGTAALNAIYSDTTQNNNVYTGYVNTLLNVTRFRDGYQVSAGKHRHVVVNAGATSGQLRGYDTCTVTAKSFLATTSGATSSLLKLAGADTVFPTSMHFNAVSVRTMVVHNVKLFAMDSVTVARFAGVRQITQIFDVLDATPTQNNVATIGTDSTTGGFTLSLDVSSGSFVDGSTILSLGVRNTASTNTCLWEAELVSTACYTFLDYVF